MKFNKIETKTTKDVEEKEEDETADSAPSFLSSPLIKYIGGAILLVGLTLGSYHMGRKSTIPKAPKEKQKSIDEYNVGSLNKYKTNQDKNDEIFNGRF